MLTPRAGCSYVVICDGKLLMSGGEGSWDVYTNVDVFDGTTWETYVSLRQSRHGWALAVGGLLCNGIYIPEESASKEGCRGWSSQRYTLRVELVLSFISFVLWLTCSAGEPGAHCGPDFALLLEIVCFYFK